MLQETPRRQPPGSPPPRWLSSAPDRSRFGQREAGIADGGTAPLPLWASTLSSWCVPLLALACFALSWAAWAQTAPGQPTNVTATAGNAQVTLGWTSGGDNGSQITRGQYKKKVGDDWETNWTDICVTSSDSTCPDKVSHTLSNLTNNTPYKFKIRAENANGFGPESDESDSATPVGEPPKPAKPTVVAGHRHAVISSSVASDNGSPVTKWRYKKKEGNTWDSDWTDISNSPGNQMTLTVVGLTNDTTYRFKVQAVNGIGASEESDESDEATPRNYDLTVEDRTETSATLRFAGYLMAAWCYKAGSGPCTEVAAGTTTVALASLEAGTSYTYAAYRGSSSTCALDDKLAWRLHPGRIRSTSAA